MAKLFFSYSHKDEIFRDELEIHLSMLKRQGIIEPWHDRRIDAGSEVDEVISQELETADIILLLVSPYFLDSNYCYGIELQRAIEKHKKGEVKIIPVIVNSCDWKNSPLSELLVIPTDGKPISKYPNHHDAFLEITTAIRSVAEKITPSNTFQNAQISKQSCSQISSSLQPPRSSNLRIKKEFSDHDKDEFLEKSFEYMCNFFEASLGELEKRNQEVTTKFRQIDANHFTSMIYLNGKVASQCKIWLGGRNAFGGGICYSSNITSNDSDSSMNDSISVETDGHILYLKPLGFSFMGTHRENSNLTQEGASEYFWELLIRNLQY